jgi:uncharacterized protein involved in outer membrane biogenesis
MTNSSNEINRAPSKNFRILKIVIFLLAIAMVLYTIGGFIILPPVVKNILIKKLPEQLHRQASIQKVSFNPFTFSLAIDGFALKKLDGSDNFVGFERLFIDVEAVSIFKRALVVKTVLLKTPMIKVTRNKDLSFNFSDLKEAKKKPVTKAPQPATRPFLFSINNIQIADGAILFNDTPKSKIHRIADVNLAVPTVSNLAYEIENYVYPAFSAVINGTKFSVGGKTKPFSETVETALDIKLTDLKLPQYLAYIPNPTRMRLNSARLDVDAKLIHRNRPGNSPRLALTGNVAVSDIDLTDSNGKSYLRLPLFSIDLADANLLAGEIHLAAVKLKEPQFEVVRNKEGAILPMAFLAPETAESGAPKSDTESSSGKPLKLTIDAISLSKGGVRFVDEFVETFTSQISPIDINITNFSTTTKTKAKYNMALKTDADESIKFSGQISLSPLRVEGQAVVDAVKLNRYAPYLKKVLSAQLTDGRFGLSTAYTYARKDSETETKLDNLGVTFADLTLRTVDGKKQIVSLPHFALSNTHFDLEKKSLVVGEVQSEGAELFLKRQKDGRIDLSDFFVPAQTDQTAAKQQKIEPAPVVEKDAPWKVSFGNGHFKGYKLTLTDQSTVPPAMTRIENLAVTLADITTVQDAPGRLSFELQLNETGLIKGKGRLGVKPVSLTIDIAAAKIGLKPLQPYLSQQLKMIVSGGDVSVKGVFYLNQQDAGMAAGFAGNAGIDGFKSLDTVLGEDLLSWQKLSFNDIRFSSIPSALSIKAISLKEVSTKLVVAENGILNLASLKTKKPEGSKHVVKDPPQKNESTQIDIERISIAGGRLSFTDRQIKPAYAAILDNIKAEVSGLSSKKDSAARLDLVGMLDGQAPLKVTGRINPLKEELYADVKLDFKNIGLSPASPYSGKYIGYKIGKGKLNLDMHYTIEGKKIKAKNNAYLDQFTLGDTVDSPAAAKLPIRLALALLKNRKGEISLDVPVQGDLSDPKFSIGGIILKVIGNLIAKAATSPFALLGALIPDGKDLQQIQFEPGLAIVNTTAAKRLEKLAQILYERPGLRMDLVGDANPQKDRPALAKIQLEKLVALQKLKDADPKQAKTAATAETPLTEAQYIHYLSRAYAEVRNQALPKDTPKQTAVVKEKKATAETLPPKPPTPPRAEMEKYLLVGIKVTDDDMRLLAIKRAKNALGFLVKTGKVGSERLFVVEPKISRLDKKDKKASTAQVKMIIK